MINMAETQNLEMAQNVYSLILISDEPEAQKKCFDFLSDENCVTGSYFP